MPQEVNQSTKSNRVIVVKFLVWLMSNDACLTQVEILVLNTEVGNFTFHMTVAQNNIVYRSEYSSYTEVFIILEHHNFIVASYLNMKNGFVINRKLTGVEIVPSSERYCRS